MMPILTPGLTLSQALLVIIVSLGLGSLLTYVVAKWREEEEDRDPDDCRICYPAGPPEEPILSESEGCARCQRQPAFFLNETPFCSFECVPEAWVGDHEIDWLEEN